MSTRDTRKSKRDMGKIRRSWEREKNKECIVHWFKRFMVFMNQPRYSRQGSPRKFKAFGLASDSIDCSAIPHSSEEKYKRDEHGNRLP